MVLNHPEIPQLHIRLMDHMELIIGESFAKEPFEKSNRSRALTAYLIMNRGKAVPFSELGQVLWKNRPIQNAANAIKVLVCRIRAQLSEVDPALHDCFIARNGSYAWNMAITASVDVFLIEELCHALVSNFMSRDEQYERLVEILGMYARKLLPELAGEPWVIEYAEYLHRQVFEAAEYVIKRLSAEEDWERVVKLCGLCVEAMPHDACWREQRMAVLMTLDRRNDAMQQYLQSVSAKRNEAWKRPTAGVVDLYEQVSQSEPQLGTDLETVSEELLTHSEMNGALYCDYVVFREVYALQRRSLERLGQMTYLGIVRISDEANRSIHVLALEEVMQRLGRILQSGLRRGDTIARYTPTQYVILLQGTKHESVIRVLERIRLAFYEELKNISIRLEFDYRLLMTDGRKLRPNAASAGAVNVSATSTQAAGPPPPGSHGNNGYSVHVLQGTVGSPALDDR